MIQRWLVSTVALILIGLTVQAHDWYSTGYFTALGFTTGDEPLKDDTAVSEAGVACSGSLLLAYKYKDVFTAACTLVSEGSSRYGLIAGSRKHTYFGMYGTSGMMDWLPFIDQGYVRVETPFHFAGLEAGVIRYGLGDKYANPGLTLYFLRPNWAWSAHVADVGRRKDIFSPDPQLRDVPGIPGDTKALFTATRISFTSMHFASEAGVDWLIDTTPPNSRWNTLAAIWGGIERDELGTMSLDLKADWPFFAVRLTGARNFGRSIPVDPDSGNRDYTGYRWDAALDVRYGIFGWSAKYIFSSGPEFDRIELTDEVHAKEYKGFAYYPPTDAALFASHYPVCDLPPVYTGGRLTPYYGVPRPGYYGDFHLAENIRALKLETRVDPIDSLELTVTYWRMEACRTAPVYESGAWNLPDEYLGYEMNAYAAYTYKNIRASVLYGFFKPGKFYRDIRTVRLSETAVSVWF